MSVSEIKTAIRELSAPELAQLRQWFAEFDSDAWDAQIEADANAGKLDFLLAEVNAEYEERRQQKAIHAVGLRNAAAQGNLEA